MAKDANTLKIVGLLVEVAKLDTVYRDIHLRRARQLLSSTFDETTYRAIGSTDKEIDDLTRRSRTAVLHREWTQAAELSARIESQRQWAGEDAQPGRHGEGCLRRGCGCF